MTARTLDTDALGCLKTVTDASRSTKLFCGAAGAVVARRTTDTATGAVSARIDLAGIGELRPNEGIFLARIPLSGSTTVEEAYSLSNGALDTSKSAYVVADMRGSTLARLGYNAPGEVKSHESEYDAWGEAVAISGLPRPTHAYTNQEPDPGTGYYHYGPRNYDPSLRRWLSPDPLIWLVPERQTAWGEQLNLYGYASNNPARSTDLTGLEVPEWIVGFGHAAGAMAAGLAHGMLPVPGVPEPPIAHDTTTKYAEQHRVGFALGQIVGGATNLANGAKLGAASGGGEVTTGGAVTPVAVLGAGVAISMAAAGAISITRGITSIAHEARGTSPNPSDKNAGPAPQERSIKELEKSIKSLGERRREHIEKLEAYKANPDAYDNQDHLKNAPNETIRQKIIATRIHHLESEIRNFEKEIVGHQATIDKIRSTP